MDPWYYEWTGLWLIEFAHKVTSLLQVWISSYRSIKTQWQPRPRQARLGWLAGFVLVLVFTQLLKKYIFRSTEQNFMYQLCIMIIHKCIRLEIVIIKYKLLFCVHRQCSVISSMGRCCFMPKPWSSIQPHFKVFFPWMRSKTLRYCSLRVVSAKGT